MEITLGLLIFAGLLILLLIGVPVAFALCFISIATLFLLEGGVGALSLVATTSWSAITSFILTAVPLYILMGAIIAVSGMGTRIYDALARLTSWLPGGLAVATTGASGIMAAVSGSSVATAGAIGSMAIKEMGRYGYKDVMRTGAVAAGGTLGIIIPPSIPMIVYGIITEQSIGKLFIAGVIPGVILMVMFSLYQIISMSFSPKEPGKETLTRVSWPERLIALKDLLPITFLILVVLGSIYCGVASPTEAAALGCVFSLILALVVYRSLSWGKMIQILMDAAKSTVMVCMIIVGAMLFGYVLTTTDVAPAVSSAVANLPVSPWMILIAINLLWLFLGCFMETISILVITIPILAPVIHSLGWDLIWFGIIATINMEMALITPPVGLNLYVVHGVSGGIPLVKIMRGSLPYVLILALGIALIALVPQLALWLPGLAR